MKSFDDLWHDITSDQFLTVQNKDELVYIYNRMLDARSYLEIGTAEGKSLYVLGHAMPDYSTIAYVDIDEDKTRASRERLITALENGKHHAVTPVHGNSHDNNVINRVAGMGQFDVVMIDAGHTTDDVLMDFQNYAPLAKKYVFMHDIELPDVRKAWNMIRENNTGNFWEFIAPDSGYGYGVVEV